MWPIAYTRHATPDSLMWTCDFGAMGCGLGPAIGAAVGRGDRLTALYIGDCGLFMSLGDLEVAACERLPLLIVCFNDGAAGSEVVLSETARPPADDAVFGVSDLAAIAAGRSALNQRSSAPPGSGEGHGGVAAGRAAAADSPHRLRCPLTPYAQYT